MDFNRMHRRKEGKKLDALQVTSMPGVNIYSRKYGKHAKNII